MLPPTLRAFTRSLVPLLPVLAIGLTALPADAAPRMGQDRHHAQDARAPRQAATVSASGQGEASVAPDLAVVNLGVTTQAPSAAEAMQANAEKQQRVIDSLKELGVAARDIQTSGLNLSPLQDYSREGQPPVITGYQAGNMVTVRVRALPDLGRVLDTLVGAGANEIQGISFQREASGEAEAEARRRAVANAAERASVVAEAAGQRLGRVLTITDGGGGMAPRPAMMRMANSDAAESTPIEAGELTVTADVMVTWEMLPARDRGRKGFGCGPHGMGGMMPGGAMQGSPMHGGMMPGMPHHGMMQGGMPGTGNLPQGGNEGMSAQPEAGPEAGATVTAPAPATGDAQGTSPVPVPNPVAPAPETSAPTTPASTAPATGPATDAPQDSATAPAAATAPVDAPAPAAAPAD